MPSPARPLRLFNSLSRSIADFVPVHAGEARVYSCGPTVYNYQHIGNMRAYVFADTLGRVLRWKGYDLRHVINITDVGHLTSDADAGDDKLERAAAGAQTSARELATFYTHAYWRDVDRLNIRQPAQWSIATDYVEAMIAFAIRIADEHCYRLDTGLYFDTTTVPDYGRLARAVTGAGEARIDAVAGKRHPGDFAIWRTTPPGETRQLEWDSPWGRGAPGWHLECSVMSEALLGLPFDIHTGGIDHREIHHPNEIAQNQAYCACADAGARAWMHCNFLVDRGAKMSKSAGEFLILDRLVERGFHPIAYRLMCISAHYRSELEFSIDNLAAAHTRLKRWVIACEGLRAEAGGEVRLDDSAAALLDAFDAGVSDDLNVAKVLPLLDAALAMKALSPATRLHLVERMDSVFGLGLDALTRAALRLRPHDARIDEVAITALLDRRAAARKHRDFATADRIRDDLIAKGVEVMDGDPIGWEWQL